MVREAMHLNGGPVCYLRMNIGKVYPSYLFFAITFLFFSWRMKEASYWEWQGVSRLPHFPSLSRWQDWLNPNRTGFAFFFAFQISYSSVSLLDTNPISLLVFTLGRPWKVEQSLEAVPSPLHPLHRCCVTWVLMFSCNSFDICCLLYGIHVTSC